MSDHLVSGARPAGFTERVALAALVAAPIVAGLGVVAMILSPEVFAEAETTTGGTPWAGAVAGLAMFLALTAVPLALFAWALHAGRRGGLVATAIAAPLLAMNAGVLPLAGALIGGWDGLSPLAVIVGAGCAVVHGFVLAAAVRELTKAPSGG